MSKRSLFLSLSVSLLAFASSGLAHAGAVTQIPCAAKAKAVIANTGSSMHNSGSTVQGDVQAATQIIKNGNPTITGTQTPNTPAHLAVVPVPAEVESDTVPTCSGCTVNYGPDPTNAVGTVQSMPQKSYTFAQIRTDFGTSQEKIFKVAVPTNNVQFTNPLNPVPVPKPASATMFLCVRFSTAPPVCDQVNGDFTVP